MTAQGWDQASYSCGRCGHSFTATTEGEYVFGHTVHLNAHALVDLLVPELRAQVLTLLEEVRPGS